MAATVNYSCASGTLSGTSCLGALRRTKYEAYGNTAAGTVPTWLGFTEQLFLCGRDGVTFETHWVENMKTGQRVEFRTKF